MRIYHLYIFFDEMSVAHFLIWCLFFYCWVLRFLYIFWITSLIKYFFANIFSQSVTYFSLWTIPFTEQNFLILMTLNHQCFSSMDCVFCVVFQKSSPNPRSPRLSPMLFPGSFIALCFTCRWNWANFYERCLSRCCFRVFLFVFASASPLVLSPFVEKTILLHWITFAFCQRSVDHNYVSLFLGSLFCSIHLFVLSPTPHSLDYCSF